MLGTAQNKKKKIDIYLDSGFKRKANIGLSGNVTWNFDVLKENSKGYQVYVKNATNGNKGTIFNPRTFWLRKQDLNVTLKKEDKPKPKPTGTVAFEDGDTMQLLDKNDVKLGVWTFKRE